MKRCKKITVLLLIILMVAGAGATSAREIGSFSKFEVTYSGPEKFTSYLVKEKTGRDGVVNLSNDTGSAWITATMRNSNGDYRGGVFLQRGTRETFETTNAVANYKYRLGLRKTNNTGGGKVTIKGSWSPDYK
ncbi:hypothetical protein SAMN05421736_11449 [Evansella caseinilytica]|uniref:DUF5626 domain-containing protein n=1 Tax=Evansella caseinilytica TaxID=1503961 RepID=A0A1H3TEL0_9BACI|nr:hypothetical protein [Evansella caseinilytica]SDZ48387.1 hypothetical protein SAMN05421736_11449 [Evansella caseinilytica]